MSTSRRHGKEPDQSMPSFFLPNHAGQAGEDTYVQLREETERQMGRPPRSARIVELWSRRGNIDCVTAVGAPDPVCGEIVAAIFDMGSRQPFVVYRQHATDPDRHSCEVLGASAYSVSEFAP